MAVTFRCVAFWVAVGVSAVVTAIGLVHSLDAANAARNQAHLLAGIAFAVLAVALRLPPPRAPTPTTTP